MPLKIELRGRGAGTGVLRVDRVSTVPESVELTIQRNDGLYLGPGRQWQATPHPFPQFDCRVTDGALQMGLGAEIIDGVIDAGGVPLRLSLRIDGHQDVGILRIRGELMGTGAAAPVVAPVAPEPANASAPEPVPEPANPAPPAVDPEPAPPGPDEQPEPGRGPWRWLGLLLLLAVLATAGAWYLGLLDEVLPRAAQTEPVAEPGPEADSSPEAELGPEAVSSQEAEPEPEPDPEPESEPEPGLEATPAAESVAGPTTTAPAPELTGRALVRQVLADAPQAAAVYARGEEAEAAGDCDAALLLFNHAANHEPAMAAVLARRYDPQTFRAGGCIASADEPYAIIFFSDAAKAGDAAAQSRLGLLMTARERSGPTFDAGVAWLRRAAAAGDTVAQARLAELEN